MKTIRALPTLQHAAVTAAAITCLLLLLAAPATAQAQFSYTTNAGGTTVTITDYTGSNTVVSIPTTNSDGLTVVSIGSSAFASLSNLTSVTIPNSVTNIGEMAFYACSDLTSVTIGTIVTSIGPEAFEADTDLTNVTFPNSLTSIGYLAFAWCDSLTSVTIPASVTDIGYGPFPACGSLAAITVNSNNPAYSSVGGVLFDNSQTLLIQCPGALAGSYTVPDSVTNIGDWAFYECFDLTSVTIPTIPNSVLSIGEWAFGYDTGLASITFGNGLNEIEDYGLYGCWELAAIYFQGNAPSLGTGALGLPGEYDPATVYYLQGTTGWSNPFGGLPAVQEAESVFGYTTNEGGTTITITNYTGPAGAVVIPTNINGLTVTAIGDGVDAVIPSGIDVTSITIPGDGTSIEAYAFANNDTLTSVTIGNGVTNIGEMAFYECSDLTSVTIGTNVTSIGEGAFAACESLISVTIPGSVTSTGDYAFQYCASLTSVTILNGVTSVGDYEFYGCSSLTSITIPGSLTSIGYQAFDYCSNLTSVTIPGNVTSIAEGAFLNCYGLISITIGNGVASIGDYAFAYCDSLTSAYFLGNAPGETPTNVFENDPTTVYYYYGTTGWSSYFGGAPTMAEWQLTFTNLHSFSVIPNGSAPVAGLVQGSDGDFYGTTSSGGTNNGGYGTVFKVTTNGVATVLYEFTGGSDGANPKAGLVLGNDGNFYGTTYGGGEYDSGTVFQITPNGAFTNLYSFTGGDDGGNPQAALVVVAGDGFYYFCGTTQYGGINGDGTVFQIMESGAFNTVYSFGSVVETNVTAYTNLNTVPCETNTYYTTNYYTNYIPVDGTTPNGLVLGLDGNLYGTTQDGGTNSEGTVFEMTTGGMLISSYSFTGGPDGANPDAALVQGSDGNFYGTTEYGGEDDIGVVFKITTNGTPATLNFFSYGNGEYPMAALVQGSNGTFYGTTEYGGDYGYGVVFNITTNGALTNLYSFTNGIDGAEPEAALAQGADGNFYGTAEYGGVNVGSEGNGTVFKISPNGTFGAVYAFPGVNDGQNANVLVQGSDGNFYGTTESGGTNYNGSVFRITTNGGFGSLYSFTGSYDGANPLAALVQGSDGNFYGTTENGGAYGYGVIFEITPAGAPTTLYAFTGGKDGANPTAALVQGGDGSYYGTTPYGGANGDGTVFKITSNGQFSTLYGFGSVEQTNVTAYTNVYTVPCETNTYYTTNYYTNKVALDGANPNGLVLGFDGTFYGTTEGGGDYGYGTVFEITPDGSFTSLYSFTGTNDGGNPYTSLVQGGDGNFYGTTSQGGSNYYGTLFRITPNGPPLATIYSFTGGTDGHDPSSLLAGTDGNFYGTTPYGGNNYSGNIFQAGTSGAFSNLYSFTGGADGSSPSTALVQGSDGSLYGTTSSGAAGGYGDVFRLSGSGLPSPLPLIAIQPSNPPPTLTGFTATLSVVALGGAPLSYQWRHNGVALSGGDDFSGLDLATLTVDAASPGDAGTYSVVVSNFYGVTASSNAILTVLADTNAMEDFEAGTNFVAVGDYAEANSSFASALSFSPANETYNFFYAATELLSLPQEPAGSNFLDHIGLGSTGRDLFNWQARLTNGVLTSLNADEFTAQLRTNVLTNIMVAESSLAQITDTNFTVDLTADETHSGAVTVDWGDVQMLQAMGDAAELFIYTTYSWNLDVQISTATNLLGKNGDIEELLTNYPSLLTTTSTADLPAAEAAFSSAINEYFAASQFIRNRPPGETFLFNLDPNKAQDELKFRETLSNLLASLNGPVALTVNSNYSVSAQAFFSGSFDLRSYLPEFQGDDFVWETFPDTTFGGVFTGLTEERLGKGLVKRVGSALDLPGTSLSVLYNFTNFSAQTGVVQGPDGSLYGTMLNGGPYIDVDVINHVGYGSVFKITTNGQFSTLYSFGSNQTTAVGYSPNGYITNYNYPLDGAYPNALVLGSDGNLYGTTESGGVAYFTNSDNNVSTNYYYGTVFEITTNGQLTSLYSFYTAADDYAYSPVAALVEGSNGLFYGTTIYGGDNGGAGTVFAISTNGACTNLYSFSGGSDGGYPAAQPLVQGANGQFYGATASGGTVGDFAGYGTIFKLDPSQPGQIVTLYTFGTQMDEHGNPMDGAVPNGLIQGADGNFYGTAQYGGANDDFLRQYGYSYYGGYGNGDGTLFSISSSGVFSNLLSFDRNFPDGYSPIGSLLPGPNGAFYGVAAAGGANQRGAVFIFNANGVASNLVWLTKSSGSYDGNFQNLINFFIYYNGFLVPTPSLLTYGSDGYLYGTTTDGGTNGSGTVYKLSLGVPVLTWPAPSPITYGTALSSNQLDATANVPGSFAYTPTNGAVLDVGTNTLCVVFTPANTNQYVTVTDCVSLVVLPSAGCAPPPSGLVSWWPANGNALDIVSGNNGILEGGVTYTNGEVGQAFNLDGATGFVATSLLITNPQTFSLSLWFRTATSNGGVLISFDSSQTNIGTYDRNMYMDTNGAVHFGVWTTSAQQINSAAGYNDDNWHQAVGSLSAGTGLSFYLDGVLVGANAAVTNAEVYNGWWRFGYDSLVYWPFPPASYYFQGQIDEVSIFNRALSSNEVAAIYHAGSAGMCMGEVPPVITAQPTNQTVPAGNSVAFAVSATGSAPLNYQWQFNTANLTDNAQITGSRSNVLTLTSVTMSNAGTYEVVVSNAYGSANASATLTVNQATPIITWANPAAITYPAPLSSSQLDATASVPGSFAYTPSNGAVLPAGSNTLSVVFRPYDTNDYRSVTDTVALVVLPRATTVVLATTNSPSGTTPISYFGKSGTTTYGQTFIAPTQSSVLTSFTVYIENVTGSTEFEFYVMAWNGSEATGPILYQSPATNTDESSGFQPYTFNTGNLALTPGASYVAFASIDTNSPAGTTEWEGVPESVYTNGYFVYDNISDLSQLTNSPWGLEDDYDDLAFVAVFGGDVVQFTATPTNGLAPLTVHFTAPANDSAGYAITSWNWNFGDGVGSSTNQNPVYTYGDAAIYSPSLSVTNSQGALIVAIGPSITVVPFTTNTGGFDVVGDFSTNTNPNGVWSYGWSTYAGGQFKLMTNATSDESRTEVGWWNGPTNYGDECFIDKDFSGSAFTNGSVVYDPDTLLMDPQSYASIARFTAPSNGTYLVTGLFRIEDIDTQAHNLTILANGTTTNFYQFTSGGSYNSEYPFLFTTALTQDETLDFIVSCYNGDYTDLSTGLKATIINASQVTEAITWTTPAPITYGTALSSNQLNATANVPGSFAYNPANGTVLNAGTNILSGTFTPTDTVDFRSVTDSVSLVVSPAPLTVTVSNAVWLGVGPIPVFTSTITGLTNGDIITATNFSCSGTNANSPEGTYPILPIFTDTNDRLPNYTVTTNIGTFTVSKGVIVTSPANGASFTTNQSITMTAIANFTNVATLALYTNLNMNSVVATANAATNISIVLSNLAPGSYQLSAVATPSNGPAVTSETVYVTVNVPGTALIDFDPLDTSLGVMNDEALSSYLSDFGVTITNVTFGTSLEAATGLQTISQNSSATNELPVPSSLPNLFTQVGSTQPVTFTLDFAAPLESFGFTRVELDTNGSSAISHPAWTASILDVSNNVLESVSEPLLLTNTNIPARTFNLVGSHIASVRFDSDSQGGTAAFAAVLLDDLVLGSNVVASPLSISLAQPAGGTSPTNITLSATSIVDGYGTNYYVAFYSGPTLIGSASNSPYSLTLNNVLNGTYTFTAQLVDASGYAVSSAPITVIVGLGANPTEFKIDFDEAEAVTDLSNYLAVPYGVTLTNNSLPGTAVVAENQTNATLDGFVIPSSLPNLLTQTGSNGPVSFTVGFTSNLLGQFSFTRPELLANPFVTHPAWQVQAFDALGQPLDSISEPQISSATNVPAQTYTLTNTSTGGGIASVEFNSEGTGFTTFNAMLLDDFVLAKGSNLHPSVLITNPVNGQVFTDATGISISAAATTGNATITGVAFYYTYDGATSLAGSAQSSPFTITWNAPSNGAYVLTAVATNNTGSGLTSTSAPVTIAVDTSFAIVTQPTNQTVGVSNSATFSVTTSPTNGVSYQWWANYGPGATSLGGQTASTLTLTGLTTNESGTYYVIASSDGQSLASSNAVLTVLGPPTISSITQTPTNVNIGDTVTLSVSTSDSVPIYYHWQRNGQFIAGSTNSSYTISNAQPSESGDYQVLVANEVASQESPTFAVAVNFGNGVVNSNNTTFATSLAINPTNGPVAGNNVNSPASGELASIAGKPAGNFLWFNWTADFTGVISLSTLGSSFDTLLGVYTGSLGSLTTNGEDDDSAGYFTSLVSFNCVQGTTYQIAVAGYKGYTGSVVLYCPNFLMLDANYLNVAEPVITQQPASQNVTVGDTVTISVTASNATTYQWYFGNAPVAGGNGSKLVVSNFPASAAGIYYVKAANGVGSVQSQPAAIEIAAQSTNGAPSNLAEDKFGDAVVLTAETTQARYRPEDSGGDVGGFTLSQSFSTVGATKEEGEPAHAGQPGGASYWYSYTEYRNGLLQFDTTNSTFNTILAVYTSLSSPASFKTLTNVGAAYITNYPVQGQPSIVVTNLGINTYYIAIDGYLGASGAAHLNVKFIPTTNTSVSPITNSQTVVAITSPANNSLTTNSNITVKGTITGSGGNQPAATNVLVTINTNAPMFATFGASNYTRVLVPVSGGVEEVAQEAIDWSISNVPLVPGANVITAQSTNLGILSMPATRTVFRATSLPSPSEKSHLILQINGDGKITGQANNAYLELNKVYTVKAVPVGNWVFTNWTSTNSLIATPNSASLSFLMSSNLILQANFVTNPFTALAGVYDGLFSPTNGVTEASSGFFTATLPVSGRGDYSAKILLDGGSYPFSGTFDVSLHVEKTVTRSGKTPLMVFLQLTNDQIIGSVINNTTSAELRADRAFNAKSNPATNYAGRYTLIIPPGNSAPTNEPGGYGYAILTNNPAGHVALSGCLGDGVAFSQSVPVATNGNIPLYASLYTRQGSLQGWLTLTNNPKTVLGTNLTWIKISSRAGTLYAGGFTNTNITILGSLYIPPQAGMGALTNLTNGTLIINGTPAYSNLAVVGDKLINNGPGDLTGVITRGTGVLTVTFRPTGAGIVGKGVVLQDSTSTNATNAAGWFLETDQSGSFLLQQQ